MSRDSVKGKKRRDCIQVTQVTATKKHDMQPIAKNIYKIGIDPGKITGLAISVNGKLDRLISSTFWDAYDLVIDEYHARRKVVSVIIEVP